MDKLKNIFIFIVLTVAVLGFLPVKDISFRVGKALIAEWALLLFCIVFLIRNTWLKLFLVWALIRTIIGYNKFSFLTFNTMFLYMMFYVALYKSIEKKHINSILNMIGIVALINVIFMLLQRVGVWVVIIPKEAGTLESVTTLWGGLVTLSKPSKLAIVGLLSNVNMTSSLLAISLPVFFRRVWVWFLPVIIIGLWLTKSMGGILTAVLVSLVFIFIKYRRSGLLISMFVLGLFSVYLFHNESAYNLIYSCGGRIQIYKSIIKYVLPLKWVVGWGVGQFKILYPTLCNNAIPNPVGGENVLQAHNEYIQLWVEMGVIGFGLACAYLVSLLRKALLNRNVILFLGLLAVMLNSVPNFLLHTTTGILLIVYAVLIEKEKEIINGKVS